MTVVLGESVFIPLKVEAVRVVAQLYESRNSSHNGKIGLAPLAQQVARFNTHIVGLGAVAENEVLLAIGAHQILQMVLEHGYAFCGMGETSFSGGGSVTRSENLSMY